MTATGRIKPRQQRGGRIGAQPLAHLVAGEPRHHHVQQDEVGRLGGDLGQPFLAGGGLQHQGHVVCPAEERKRIQLSNLWLSSLQWFGVERERFGRSTGTFSPMKIG